MKNELSLVSQRKVKNFKIRSKCNKTSLVRRSVADSSIDSISLGTIQGKTAASLPEIKLYAKE